MVYDVGAIGLYCIVILHTFDFPVFSIMFGQLNCLSTHLPQCVLKFSVYVIIPTLSILNTKIFHSFVDKDVEHLGSGRKPILCWFLEGVCVVYHSEHVENGACFTEVGSRLPPAGQQGLSSGQHAWQQGLLCADPCCLTLESCLVLSLPGKQRDEGTLVPC